MLATKNTHGKARRNKNVQNTEPRKGVRRPRSLGRRARGLAFPQLLEKVACNKTSLFRIVLTLEKIGYIRKNRETGTYSITKKILPLAYSSLCDANLVEESLPVMRRIRDTTGETVMLGAYLNGECVMISQESGEHPFNFMGKLGMTSPLHASAPGKAILAAMSKGERLKTVAGLKLEKLAKNTITDSAELLRALGECEKNGYSTDESEAVDGVNCVSAAIFDRHGFPAAALWITAPAGRIDPKDFPGLGGIVKASAAEISENLGYGAE